MLGASDIENKNIWNKPPHFLEKYILGIWALEVPPKIQEHLKVGVRKFHFTKYQIFTVVFFFFIFRVRKLPPEIFYSLGLIFLFQEI